MVLMDSAEAAGGNVVKPGVSNAPANAATQ